MIDLEPYMSGDVGRALRLLSQDELNPIRTRLSERDGKLFVRCLKREKPMRVTPEEIIRQLWLDR